jgi:hypothetical protein
VFLAPEVVMHILSYNGTDMILSSPSLHVATEWFQRFQECLKDVQQNPLRRLLAPLYR